jgi:glycine cleavage system H protein
MDLKNLKFTKEHEWVRLDGDEATVGVTDFAAGELGDIVYVELPEVGDQFKRKEVFGTVEAVKAVSDLYFPVSGEVVEVNDRLADDPALVNADPYGKGWMLKVRLSDEGELEQLLGADEYGAQIG